eukprot:936436-Prymnesium_polylepis.1
MSTHVAAMRTLGKLDPTVLAQHAPAIVAVLEKSVKGDDAPTTMSTRVAAMRTLGKLDPTVLAQPALALLDHCEQDMRVFALELLRALDPAVLAQHAPAIVAVLEKSVKGDDAPTTMSTRVAAMRTLGKLDPAALAQHAPAIVAVLEESFWGSGNSRDTERANDIRATLHVLGKLDRTVLAAHAPAIAALLEGNRPVRRMALKMLNKFDSAAGEARKYYRGHSGGLQYIISRSGAGNSGQARASSSGRARACYCCHSEALLYFVKKGGSEDVGQSRSDSAGYHCQHGTLQYVGAALRLGRRLGAHTVDPDTPLARVPADHRTAWTSSPQGSHTFRLLSSCPSRPAL